MTAKLNLPLEGMTVGSGEHLCYVYGLYFEQAGHKYTGRVRYVGKALDPLRRFRAHMNSSQNYGRVRRSVTKNGSDCYSLVVLAKAKGKNQQEAEKLALKWECHFISHLQTATGRHGLNLTTGGEGLSFVGEAKRRHRIASQRTLREIIQRPEVRKKISDNAKKRLSDPYFREILWGEASSKKKGDALRNKYRTDPAYREVRLQTLAIARVSPKAVEWAKKHIKFLNTDPDVRRRRADSVKRYNTDEVRSAKSATATALHQDPEFAQKYSDGLRRRYADPANVESHARKTRERHDNPAFVRSAKIGIHLHWAKKHLADGKSEAAARQIVSLRALLDQCGDDPNEIRVKLLAQSFLDRQTA